MFHLCERSLSPVKPRKRSNPCFGCASLFWLRWSILVITKAARERLQDALFGAVLGGFNGYLIAGTALFYNHDARYPFPNIISPATDPGIVDTITRMMAYMPPRFLGEPGIYFAVIIILIFIIVVYI